MSLLKFYKDVDRFLAFFYSFIFYASELWKDLGNHFWTEYKV